MRARSLTSAFEALMRFSWDWGAVRHDFHCLPGFDGHPLGFVRVGFAERFAGWTNEVRRHFAADLVFAWCDVDHAFRGFDRAQVFSVRAEPFALAHTRDIDLPSFLGTCRPVTNGHVRPRERRPADAIFVKDDRASECFWRGGRRARARRARSGSRARARTRPGSRRRARARRRAGARALSPPVVVSGLYFASAVFSHFLRLLSGFSFWHVLSALASLCA